MFQIRQYDVDASAPPITDDELRRRWAQFHHNIRMVAASRWRQVVGRLLGDDTWRYRAARLVGRPVLRVVRRVRGTRKKPPISLVETVEPDESYFPINYRPHLLERPVRSLEAQRDSGATVLRIDESSASPREVINRLNEELAAVTTTWVILADVADTLGDAVFASEVLATHAEDDADVVFADEFFASPHQPTLKSPAVGYHTLLSYNAVGRPALVRTRRLRDLGGFDAEAGWAFEHDVYLRLHEAGAVFQHVPLLVIGGRPAFAATREHLDGDTVAVVEHAIARRGWRGTVTPGDLPGTTRWRLEVPTPAPSIDILIPTRDRIDLVRRCVDSIRDLTTYPNYRIVILDNDSAEPASLAYFDDEGFPVVKCPGPFNYAHIVNRGVAAATAEYVVTLNNDTIIVTPDWLERLVALASLDDVGFVGACLLDQDGRREHEGIVITPYPQHLRTDSNYPVTNPYTVSVRDVAAVTGAVQMVRRTWWNELGGMDEDLAVVMNDVDICLRSLVAGRAVVFDPDVRLYHHVSSSRGSLDPLVDRNRFIRRWDIFGTFRDPYFPESLLLLGETMYYRFR